ncbi:Uncharacterised protein [Citrobacter werkmanii]|uniref:Terminase n=1 Tax=Citrobacter werkmanii TaxID=67827 RepID=A0A9N8GVC2_9ENTR|nr:hypothetical protein [Citrobacter werkmanii]CAB5549113.1 Uncharacterised protein [Citrobacter werkmanii]CAB5577176.1 Uncharacterised protein [Citrobacter werkmanii]CAB5590911.1 Uncharacterised protein [Citrobacter werkmanii]CAB5592302.1 Uncharacterised protein [Citrobacter werkmanii]CAB5592589.1 Uncharacterised protein [Citrobacter werkmanii]
MAVKTDWSEHRNRYAEMRAAGEKISIKEYALTYGLNPNTARRYLGEGTTQLGKVQDQRSADQIVKKAGKRSNDQKKSGKRKSDHKSSKQNKNLSQEINELSLQVKEAGRHARVEAGQTEEAVLVGKLINAVSTKTKSGRTRDQYMAGSQILEASIIPSDEDMEEARKLIAAAGVDDIEAMAIESSLVNLFCLNRTVKAVLTFLTEQPPASGDDDESGPNPITKALSVAAAAAGAINDTARSLAGIRQSYAKNKREQELHDRKTEEPERIMQAYQQRKENGWSAVDTAIYIETHGYKVPALLMEMARKEVKDGESDKVKAVAYDPEELDRQAREARAIRHAQHEQLMAEKREAVNLLVDGGGFGDVAADGSLNDINLTAQFADDEIPDDEVNNLLYGGDDGSHN